MDFNALALTSPLHNSEWSVTVIPQRSDPFQTQVRQSILRKRPVGGVWAMGSLKSSELWPGISFQAQQWTSV
jgi:hypothetical protein